MRKMSGAPPQLHHCRHFPTWLLWPLGTTSTLPYTVCRLCTGYLCEVISLCVIGNQFACEASQICVWLHMNVRQRHLADSFFSLLQTGIFSQTTVWRIRTNTHNGNFEPLQMLCLIYESLAAPVLYHGLGDCATVHRQCEPTFIPVTTFEGRYA